MFCHENVCFTMKMVGLRSNGWVILVWDHGNLDEHCGVFMVFEE